MVLYHNSILDCILPEAQKVQAFYYAPFPLILRWKGGLYARSSPVLWAAEENIFCNLIN